jgi:glycosyltransferase involved in cell wall biosynthesis
VHVVVPGANLNPDAYGAWDEIAQSDSGRDPDRAPRIVFVGKYWHRKGLDRLLEALQIARARGAAMSLRVIGCERNSLPAHLRGTTGVEWIGFVSKSRDPTRFNRLVAQCDVGCLLSRAEAGGIALREYHALGLAVLGPKTGGAPDHMFQDAAIMIEPTASAEVIAGRLLALEREPGKLELLRAAARGRRHEALWSSSIDKIRRVMGQCVIPDVESPRQGSAVTFPAGSD